MTRKSINVPVTAKEMAEFKDNNVASIGGKTFIANDINGKPVYAPNRKERRRNPSTGNNRKITKGRKLTTLYEKKEEDSDVPSTKVKTQFNSIYISDGGKRQY